MSQVQPKAAAATGEDARRHKRYTIAAMYSLVRARARHEADFTRTGHIYDISAGGMRFELDHPVEPGTELEIRAMLPAAEHITFRAAGTVVRLHNPGDDERGPTRMGLTFTRYKSTADQQRVAQYIAGREGHPTIPSEPTPTRPLYMPNHANAA